MTYKNSHEEAVCSGAAPTICVCIVWFDLDGCNVFYKAWECLEKNHLSTV